jgi:hypothetical protein
MVSRAVLLSLVASAGCVHQAQRPNLTREATQDERRREYDANKLVFHEGFLAPKFERADGSFVFGQLEEVVSAYPRSEDVYRSAKIRAGVLGGLSGLGGALIGGTLGYNLAAPSNQRMSRNTQIASYATGGGLVVTAILLTLLWHNPIEDLAPEYNDSLSKDLKLSAPSASAEPATNAHTMGVGWQF